MKGKRFESLT